MEFRSFSPRPTKYTLRAFQTTGIAYLLKPFEQVQLAQAMDKFQSLKKSFPLEDQRQLILELKKIHTCQNHLQYQIRSGSIFAKNS